MRDRTVKDLKDSEEVFEVEYVTYSEMCFGEVFEVEPALATGMGKFLK